MALHKNKYRDESLRLKGWDYASTGYYYLTICTKYRKTLFGSIINGHRVLSDLGLIVFKEWKKSFVIRKELFCDSFVIMPNHIHGIILINNAVGPHGRGPLRAYNHGDFQKGNPVAFRPPKSIPSFVAGFKSAMTKQINEYRNTPGKPVWQTGYYDHIVRNKKDLVRIRRYIKNNPAKWQMDALLPRP